MAGIREQFNIGTKGDTTDVDAGMMRKKKKSGKGMVKIPKDKGRPKRKKKVTFNSPKTTKISYG